MRLIVYHVNQDDPKKCTARKMERFGLAKIVRKVDRIPRKAIILNPFARIPFSRLDREISSRFGIAAIDCSWKEVERAFSKLSRFPNQRSLPFLIPVNPINFGRPSKLSTLEAFIACLYIIGEDQLVERLSGLYKWSPHFLEINRELLDTYRNSKNPEEILEKLERFF